MEALGTFEKVLVGILAVLVLLWFRPGIKAAFEKSKQSEREDWRGVLIPILVVVLFVILLIQLV